MRADAEPRLAGDGLPQPFRSKHMCPDQSLQRLQRHRRNSHFVGQGRYGEVNAFSSVALALLVQGLMLPELLKQDRRQEVRADEAARRYVEGRGRDR